MRFDFQAEYLIRSPETRALRLLLEHGAQSPRSFVEKFYPTAPKWHWPEAVRRAERLLVRLRKKGLVKRCRRIHLFYISDKGRRHLEWIDSSRSSTKPG